MSGSGPSLWESPLHTVWGCLEQGNAGRVLSGYLNKRGGALSLEFRGFLVFLKNEKVSRIRAGEADV